MVVPVATATVCADSTDFTTDAGRLKLLPHSVQNDVEAFAHIVGGSQDVFEKITEFDDVVIQTDGWYLVTMDVHGDATTQTVGPGSDVGAVVVAQLRVNDLVVAGTETTLQMNVHGQAPVQQAALTLHGSGSCTRRLLLTSGQRLSIWAKSRGEPGTIKRVVSDGDGRCRITAVRFAGA